ncbi:MAG: glycosyltransferase family 25 protein [Cyanobacteria bacterium P01_A01_bin.135]
MGESVNQRSDIAALCQQFDRVYCVSLSRSRDRRQYIQGYFSELGVDDYQFWDATDKTDPLVAQYYEAGLVQQYPPCFRCGQYTCGDDNCNNVLIPPQVATFITYLRLWREIVASGVGRALVVEDDVKFAPYANQTARQLVEGDQLNAIDFVADVPGLLRFGWALCKEHQPVDSPGFQADVVRYSNPCHALTRAMAELLLQEFDKITTTVDVYQHKIIAAKTKTYTLMPPLAYELSWSVGEFASLIHPKQIRIDYLQEHQPQATTAIQQAQHSFDGHHAHILYRALLVIGHPRCGSGYMSALLKAFGLDVGHEKMGQAGISSWMFAVEDDQLPYGQGKHSASTKHKYFRYRIHHVRDPRVAIPSIMRDSQHAPPSYGFRQKHIQLNFDVDLDACASDLEKAVLSYVYWNRLASRDAELTVRIEDGEAGLLAFLKETTLMDVAADLTQFDALPAKTINANKPYQGKRYDKPQLTRADWRTVPPPSLALLNAQCARYGYDPIQPSWLKKLWNLTRL